MSIRSKPKCQDPLDKPICVACRIVEANTTNKLDKLNKMNMNYTEQQVDKMRAALHESEFDCMTDRDIRLLLWDGHTGWKNIADDVVIEEFESFFDITEQEEMTREG